MSTHPNTEEVIYRINEIKAELGWTLQDLANKLNSYLSIENKFNDPMSPYERTKLDRWISFTEPRHVKPTGDYLLAFDSLRKAYR